MKLSFRTTSLFLSLFFISCENGTLRIVDNEIPAGGQCSYDRVPFATEITSVQVDSACLETSLYPETECKYRVWLRAVIRHEDSLDLGTAAHQEITADLVKQLGLKKGRKIEGVLATIRTGTCTPELYQFKDSVLNGW